MFFSKQQDKIHEATTKALGPVIATQCTMNVSFVDVVVFFSLVVCPLAETPNRHNDKSFSIWQTLYQTYSIFCVGSSGDVIDMAITHLRFGLLEIPRLDMAPVKFLISLRLW